MLVQDAITEMLMTGMKCTQTWTETDIRSRKKKVSETLKTKHQNDYSLELIDEWRVNPTKLFIHGESHTSITWHEESGSTNSNQEDF